MIFINPFKKTLSVLVSKFFSDSPSSDIKTAPVCVTSASFQNTDSCLSASSIIKPPLPKKWKKGKPVFHASFDHLAERVYENDTIISPLENLVNADDAKIQFQEVVNRTQNNGVGVEPSLLTRSFSDPGIPSAGINFPNAKAKLRRRVTTENSVFKKNSSTFNYEQANNNIESETREGKTSIIQPNNHGQENVPFCTTSILQNSGMAHSNNQLPHINGCKYKKIRFAPDVIVTDTLSSVLYDRRMLPSWRTASEILAIQDELNRYKENEMEVHPQSMQYTSFIYESMDSDEEKKSAEVKGVMESTSVVPAERKKQSLCNDMQCCQQVYEDKRDWDSPLCFQASSGTLASYIPSPPEKFQCNHRETYESINFVSHPTSPNINKMKLPTSTSPVNQELHYWPEKKIKEYKERENKLQEWFQITQVEQKMCSKPCLRNEEYRERGNRLHEWFQVTPQPQQSSRYSHSQYSQKTVFPNHAATPMNMLSISPDSHTQSVNCTLPYTHDPPHYVQHVSNQNITVVNPNSQQCISGPIEVTFVGQLDCLGKRNSYNRKQKLRRDSIYIKSSKKVSRFAGFMN